MPMLSARDRAAALAILENAQWVFTLGRYPKKQVLDDPVDVKMLRDRVEAMRKAAGQLSAAQKKKVDVPWDKVAEPDETLDALWAMAKRITPKLITEMRPLVRDTPEAAFLISPEKKTPAKKKAKKKKSAAPRKRKK
ncbi:MAG TPA: hypothetical protein VIN63_08310 [Candidatus Limnocylindria bacterium]